MTDKVQKIREEVVGLQKRAEHNFDISLTENERQFWLGESNVLTLIEKYIDSLQKEPKQCMYSRENYTEEDRKVLCEGCDEKCKENGNSLTQESVSKVWHYQKKEPVNEIVDKSRPIIVVYGNNSLNAAGKFRYYEDNSDAIWLSNSYEKWAFVEDLINLTHSVTKVSWQEEPVSEGLEEASKEWLKPQLDKSYADYGEVKMMELTHFDGYAMLDAIEFGAKWKEQQMMAKAIKGGCFSYKNGFVHISCDIDEHLTDIKMGDKVKVIVIKED